jgi:hypothetical protein
LGDRIETDSRLGWANELDTEPDACARAWAFSKVAVGRQGSPGPSTGGWDGRAGTYFAWEGAKEEGQAPGHQGTRAPGQGRAEAPGAAIAARA